MSTLRYRIGSVYRDHAGRCLERHRLSPPLHPSEQLWFKSPECISTVFERPAIVSREADIGALAVMNARVERVVRGTLDSDALKIVTYLSTCTRLGVGHGFVAGRLDHDAQLGLKLTAIQRSYEILIQKR